ncbi:MAG: hypothetical protein HY246_09410 [Proteobacteria bacterium]|nr:hypothetical protein [Pseudomonadota bacterium]
MRRFVACRAIWLAAAVLAGVDLVACSGFDFDNLPGGTPSAPSPGSESGVGPRPAAPPATRQAARPAPETGIRTAPTPAVEIKLVGLSEEETIVLLGQPAAESDAAPAKLWEYRGRDCVLDVYFYLDVSRNGFYALHYAARGGSAAPSRTAPTPTAEGDRCLRRIYDDKRRR